jgi:hypothetical protein
MIIDDGYTEDFQQFRLRRFIKSERDQFNELLAADKLLVARHMVSTHITDPDGMRVSLELVPHEVAEAVVNNPTEFSDRKNLISGMRLLLKNPLLAIRPCQTCNEWWFDPDTNKIVQVGGQNLRRPDHSLTMCQTERGCDKGTPESPLSLNFRNQKAFNHWQQWRFVGCPCPNDAIVRMNWMWFESIRENHGLRKARN